MTDIACLVPVLGVGFAATEYLATETAPGLDGWPQFGLIGVVLAMVFWLLKQFFESTMKQQAALVSSMQAIQESSMKTALMVADLQARMVSHMEKDENTDTAILDALRKCGRTP